ncbi:hypothetical protein CJ030_MR5G003516 [Morella rubra]|uniref:Uncharacterized protein n=1 Tax=Morella rubra TaxID=262757 RepID=A0A6A1VKZ3_9ROSI|nr:hypothetical protein CJ030_MR5G003519 [Morella rubra]KAB1213414.1 hypothetical protein CJ030_MR5G003516 [Morella rubra]
MVLNGMSLGSLKHFDLSKSERLIETPDFIEVPNLETLHLEGLSSLKVLELPCSRFRDMDSGEGLILKHLSHRITIKFSNDISVPLPNFHRDIVTAFYIRFDGQHYGIKNWDVITAKSRVSTSVCKVLYGSSAAPRILDWFNNISLFSFVTVEMHPDLDNKKKVKGCALFIVYECCSFSSISHFVLGFKADEGPLTRRGITLGAEVFSHLGSIWAYIPANWFLVRGENMDTWSYLKVLVASRTMGVKVKECGVRLVHQHDAMEFYDSITFVYPMGSMDSELLHLLSCYPGIRCCGAEPLEEEEKEVQIRKES